MSEGDRNPNKQVPEHHSMSYDFTYIFTSLTDFDMGLNLHSNLKQIYLGLGFLMLQDSNKGHIMTTTLFYCRQTFYYVFILLNRL